MRSSDFAAMLRAIPRPSDAAAIAALADAFAATPLATAAASTKRLSSDESGTFWPSASVLAHALADLRPLLRPVAKAGVIKDIDGIVGMLERGPSASASPRKATRPAAKSKADPAAVTSYLERLTDALGDERRFADVFQQLEQDASLATGDFRALAKDFAKATARSKADALKKIWARQQSLLGFEAKARATDGRSAA